MEITVDAPWQDGLLILDVVATDDEGRVIGYAGYCPVWINSVDHQWMAVAPLTVGDVRR